MKKRFPTENNRISHINFTMEKLYSTVPTIYEHWIDMDYHALRATIKDLSRTLKEIDEAIEDEA